MRVGIGRRQRDRLVERVAVARIGAAAVCWCFLFVVAVVVVVVVVAGIFIYGRVVRRVRR